MQSKIGFLALTLANLVVAGPCKPSRPTTVSSVSLVTSVTTADISELSTDVLNSQTTTDTLSVELSTTTSENKDSTDVSSSQTIVDRDSVTISGPTSDITSPTLTFPQSSTTTEEEVIITTLSNSLAGGSFASRDPDSPSGLKDFGATGNAEFHSGGCYKGDGSPDDGCAALTAGGSPDGKRSFFGRFASIYQVIKAAPRKKYTIQFLYLVTSTGGSQDCVVSATFGNRKFFSLPATSPGGTTVNWARVLEQVETIGQDPAFDISLECTGPGYSSILVDSIFISDKVTPETIGNYHLQFDSYTEPETTTTSYQETSQTAHTGASSTVGITATGSDAVASDTTVSSQTTFQGDKTTLSSEATATSKCAVECDLIDDFQNNNMCDLVGVFVKTDAIYGFPGDDNYATQYRSKSITECADFCKRDMPGCKSVGFQKLSGRCFFSNTVVTQDDITDGRDSQMADWYNIEGCFTCHVSGCESGTLAPEIPSTTEVPVISHTTTTTQPTQSVCKSTCERIQDLSEHEDWNCGRLYGHVSDGVYTLPGDEEPDWSNHRFDNVAQCAEVCRTLPGCIYTGYQFASQRCFFSNREITEVEQAGDSQSADWNELKCLACSGCGLDESTTSQAPTSEVAIQSSTSKTPTSLVTTTKAPQATGACHNNHGEVCEISSSGVDNTPYVCITGGIFSGPSWTEPRSKYPLQESQKQCAAICDTLEDCETSAFWGSENHCIFTSTKITSSDLEEPDPNLDDPSFDPKSAAWSHKSCWTCPTCVPNNSPLPKSPTCNYKQGDSCTRLMTATGVCNASGWLSTGYRAMASEWYPDQSSSAKCAAICRANSRCKGSSHIGGQCYIADDALTPGAVVTRPNINHVWDEPSCWDCPGCHT